MPKATMLKGLEITEVSSVTSGAAPGAKVLVQKSADDSKPELPMLDDLVDAVMAVQKIDRPHAFVKVMATQAGNAAYRREADVRLAKAAARGGAYGHGEVVDNSTSFNANSDEVDSSGRVRPGLPATPDKLQRIADAQARYRKAVDKIRADSAFNGIPRISRSEAARIYYQQTDEGKAALAADLQYGLIGA